MPKPADKDQTSRLNDLPTRKMQSIGATIYIGDSKPPVLRQVGVLSDDESSDDVMNDLHTVVEASKYGKIYCLWCRFCRSKSSRLSLT